MKEQRTPRGGGRSAPEYGIVARFPDGSRSYYHVDERHLDAHGRPAERWGRESQAVRFRSAAEAQQVASGMQTNSQARAYEVVPLAPSRQRRAAAPRPGAPGSQRSG